MKTKEKKIINLRESNRITYESLKDIKESIFEDIYLQADRTLVKIIEDGKVYKEEEGKDRQSLNAISFLGGRGRVSTTASAVVFLVVVMIKHPPFHCHLWVPHRWGRLTEIPSALP